MQRSRLYIPSLDGLRAIAFLIVLVAHALPQKDLPGGFGVTVFFFLSGYLITTLLRAEAQTTSDISLRDFYIRRILRIFPPCYLTVTIIAPLAAAGVIYNTESFRSLFSAFFYFSNYWNIFGLGNLPAGLGVLWSLAVEEHYYLLFPLLYRWFVRRSLSRKHQAGYLLVLCGLALAWRCFRSGILHSPWENIYEGTDTRFDSILFGCILGVAANPRLDDGMDWLKKHAAMLALAGAGVIVLSFAYRNPFFRDTFRYTLQGIGLMPIFFLAALPEKHLLNRILEFRPLRHLGLLSYTMYLIHHTLFHHIYQYHRPSLLIGCGVLAASAVFAQGMRTLVELPLQKTRTRFATRRPPLLISTKCIDTPPSKARRAS